MSEHVIESSQRANTTPAAAKGPVLSRRRETDLPEKAVVQQRQFVSQTGACKDPCFGFNFSGVPVFSGMARQNMPVLRSQPLVQRFPLNEGEASSAPCPNCPEVAANQDSEVSASEPEVSESVPEAGPTAEASSSAEETAAPEATSAAALIADEPAGALAPGQMRRGEFLARLRAEVTQAAESALAGTGRTTEDCPYLEYWFGYYQDQDSEHIERAIHRYAPETTAVRNAADYFPVIARRVGVSVERWARTGEITGVPEGLSGMGMMGMGLLGGLAGLVSGIGRMFFKARAGGARKPDDPRAIQAELGEGRSLDSGVRSRMESAFGMDFSHVRAHTDNAAAGLSTRMNARAFTVGEHVAFGGNEYKPGTLVGDAIIAHELAHVVQQGKTLQHPRQISNGATEYDRLEEDADQSAVGAILSLQDKIGYGSVGNRKGTMPLQQSGLRLQRCGGTHAQGSVQPVTTPGQPVRLIDRPGMHQVMADMWRRSRFDLMNLKEYTITAVLNTQRNTMDLISREGPVDLPGQIMTAPICLPPGRRLGPNEVLLGTIHTHPNTSAEGRQEPNTDDMTRIAANPDRCGTEHYVIADEFIYQFTATGFDPVERREDILGSEGSDGMVQKFPAQAQIVEVPARAATEEATAPETFLIPGLIVEDEARDLEQGQMRKSEFLDELQNAVRAAADEELSAVGRTADGCPYIERWIGSYRVQSSQHLERAIRRYAPETAGITAARDYIPLVAGRIRRAVAVWAATGEITEVPEELEGQLPEAGGLGTLGRIFSGMVSGITGAIGGLFGKAQEGGLREGDPGVIRARLGSGRPLEGDVKSRMEYAFAHDFSNVRVHTDATAVGLSTHLNARAFTVGKDVAFASGEYLPGTLTGDALIAHELAHVVQQSGATSSKLEDRKTYPSMLEQDADRSAIGAVISSWGGGKRAMTRISESALPRLRSGLSLQRCSRPLRTEQVTPREADTYIQGRFGSRVAQAITEGRTAARAEFHIVGDREFCAEAQAVNAFCVEQGEPLDDTPCERKIAFVDPRPFTPRRVWIHRGRQTTETVLHEALHLYCHPDFEHKLRNRIKEGTTEYFTRKIANAQRIAISGSYEERYQQICVLTEVIGNDAPLERAYFEGDVAGLKRAVDAIRSPSTFEAWRCEMTLGNYENAEQLIRGEPANNRSSALRMCADLLPPI